MKQKIPLLISLLFLLLHLPFFEADPDTNISFSRDAFTDEGLYTSQVRNYLITGEFRLEESDATVKTPLFSGLMLSLFSITGINLTAARVLVLLICLAVFYFITRRDSLMALLLGTIIFLQYTIFQYSHIALSEMLSVSCLTLGWYFMTKNGGQGLTVRSAFVASLMITLAWWFKFQFLYMMVWPLIFYVMTGAHFSLIRSDYMKQAFRNGALSLMLIFIMAVLYYVAWYIPSRELFDFVMKAQASAPFGEGEWFWKMIHFNINSFFLNESMVPLTILFLLMVLMFPFILYRHRHNTELTLQLFGAFSWCILELYKPALSYLPGRYLVSTFFAMGLFSCICIRGIYLTISERNLWKSALIILVATILSANMIQYYKSYMRRTYIIKEANEFVAENSSPGCYVTGPWAPAVTWKSDVPSIPVWIDYFNYKNTLTQFKPCIIISETDEEDSGNAWTLQGVNLSEIADTTYDFKIHNWKVKIYVLGK